MAGFADDVGAGTVTSSPLSPAAIDAVAVTRLLLSIAGLTVDADGCTGTISLFLI